MSENFNIVDLFFNAAKKYPLKTAIIYKNEQISFEKLEKQVNETATYFIEKGICKSDRVLIFVPMSIDLYRIVLALFSIGSTAVFLDEWVSKKRMEECCKVAQCKAFVGIFKTRVFSFFSSELRNIPIKLGVSFKPSSKKTVKIITNIDDTALITFTTGSTGIPKAAKRTHGFLHEQFNALIEKINPQPDDVDMPVLPIVLLINLGVGCTSVISHFKASKPNSLNPKLIIGQIEKHKVNRLVASPFFVKKLSQYILKNNISLKHLKKLFTGGAPVFPNEAELYDNAFPQALTEIVYGSTEAEPISSINVKELLKENENILTKGLNIGKPYHKIELKIIEIKDENIFANNESELQTLPIGSIGEIIVSGSHILREYVNNETALKRNKIFIGEKCWHRTGDSGYIDENGVLYLTGRCNTVIKQGKKIIAPFLYENYFQTIEGVEIGTILQIKDKIVVIIETSNNVVKLKFMEEIKNLDIMFDEVKFLNKIPRDPRHNSKIDYSKLIELF